jgi:parallel beta-helix repeat protein
MRAFTRPSAIVVVAALAAMLVALPKNALAAHLQCGDLVTQDTALDSDLTNCPGFGLVIREDGVDLDLGGHLIHGQSDRAGVLIQARNVSVRNGRIEGFSTAVLTNLAQDTTVEDVQARRSQGAAFACEDSHNCYFVGDVAIGAQVGFDMDNGDFPNSVMVVRDSVAEVSGVGVRSVGAVAHVSTNLIRGATTGVLVSSGHGFSAYGSVVASNRITDNAQYGVLLLNDGGFTVRHNRILRNGLDGIRGPLAGSPGNSIIANTVIGNGHDGVYLEASNSLVARNRANRNGDDGIELHGTPPSITVTGNQANWNADLGIEALGDIRDGDGNRARHNGNPAQCVGVACR